MLSTGIGPWRTSAPCTPGTSRRTWSLPDGSVRSLSLRQILLAPHLHYPQFMDNVDRDARALVVLFNRILLSKCEQLWANIGRVSAGMRAEIDWAYQMDIPVRFFDADFQEVHPA